MKQLILILRRLTHRTTTTQDSMVQGSTAACAHGARREWPHLMVAVLSIAGLTTGCMSTTPVPKTKVFNTALFPPDQPQLRREIPVNPQMAARVTNALKDAGFENQALFTQKDNQYVLRRMEAMKALDTLGVLSPTSARQAAKQQLEQLIAPTSTETELRRELITSTRTWYRQWADNAQSNLNGMRSQANAYGRFHLAISAVGIAATIGAAACSAANPAANLVWVTALSGVGSGVIGFESSANQQGMSRASIEQVYSQMSQRATQIATAFGEAEADTLSKLNASDADFYAAYGRMIQQVYQLESISRYSPLNTAVDQTAQVQALQNEIRDLKDTLNNRGGSTPQTPPAPPPQVPSVSITVMTDGTPLTADPTTKAYTVKTNSTVTISVAVTPSNTALKYAWSKDGKLLSENRVSGASTSLLTIRDVVAADKGVYSVSISGTPPGQALAAPPVNLDVK